MIIYAIFCALFASANCHNAHRVRIEDPFASLDKHISHTLAFHYLWPWNQLMKVAAALDAEEYLEEPKIVSDPSKHEINMSVKRFKPEELRIKVKNRYIIVEGQHKEANPEMQFLANHFVQRFVLPPGSKQEEVVAILKDNGVLSISVPKHPLPPPPPEREVPIIVLLPEKTEPKPVKEAEKVEKVEIVPEKVEIVPEKVEIVPEKVEIVPEKVEKVPEKVTEIKVEATTEKKEPSTTEQFDLAEATTHIGKIRKKELKTTTKTTKDNEVTKEGDGNIVDYAFVED